MKRQNLVPVSIAIGLVLIPALAACGAGNREPATGPQATAPFQIRGEGSQPPAGPTPSTVEPPAAVLKVAGREQVSGIGSYCWSEPTGGHPAVSVCADRIGILTPEEPLAVPPVFMAYLSLSPEEPPVELALRVRAVSPEDELGGDQEGWRAWPAGPGETHTLALRREPAVELELKPGLYVLDLFARWEEHGDASYGFLIEVVAGSAVPVAEERPSLVIEETPIISDAVDRPGHLEYMDRLGDEILARLEGLRTRDAELRLAEANEVLAAFGYRLESRFDAEWNRTFYDLMLEGEADPVLAGLSHVWPVSVNASGTDFVMAAENAPNVLPMYLVVRKGSVEEWEAMTSNLLPPAYLGEALATITTTPEMTFTYQVRLEGEAVYTGTAAMTGAYHPLRSFTTWDSHWALEVDDRLIVDGQDVSEVHGYDAVYGFARIQGESFFFFEQNGQVRISYGGQTLPNAYDRVFHNQCCEAAIHNVERLADSVLFHALWDGTWYFVEAGVFDGEMAGTLRYTAPEGWSFRYPAHWDRLDPVLGFVQETATGKTVTFESAPTSEAELKTWLESEIARKLEVREARNTLDDPLTESIEGDLTVYRYVILSETDRRETLLATTVFFDGQRRYALHAALPPVTEEEYEAIVETFHVGSGE